MKIKERHISDNGEYECIHYEDGGIVINPIAKESNEKRIVVCKHTGKEVVQQLNGGEWICLHNNDDELDAYEVREFKKKQG